MLPPLWRWIFWLVHASTLVSFIDLAEIPTSCGPNCAFLRAAECIFLQRPTYECSSHDVNFPPSLSKLLESLPDNIKNSILNGNFKVVNSSDITKVCPSLLNLIPAKVIQLNAEIVSTYLRVYPHESSAATKLISSLNSSLERKSFLEIWNGDESNSKIEDIIALALTKWKLDKDWNFLSLVDSNSMVLLRVPPEFLLTFDTKGASEFLFHLGSKFNSISHGRIRVIRVLRSLDSKNLKVLQRAWAILAMRELPDKIKWNKYNFILPGLTLDELKKLEIDEIKPLLGFDFNAAQVRIIVSKILVPWHINFNQVALWVKFMSSSQIQNLWQFNFKDLKIMANETASYIAAKQILLYQLYQLNQKYVKDGKYPNLSSSDDLLKLDGGFAAILPLRIIEQLSASSVLTLDSLQKIDSRSLSLSAAYYLTDQSSVFNLGAPSRKLTTIRGMLQAIPTSQIMAINGEMSSTILHHLLQNLQGDNVLRNLELLKKCRSFLGNADYVLKYLLENKEKNMYFSLLSPKDIAHISLSSISNLVKDNYGPRIQELPSHILAAILSNNSPYSWTWSNMLNSSNAFHPLLMGLNCKELLKIADSDFITIIGRYNDERIKISKVFPKNLQRCGQVALIHYLLLKSNLYNEPELIDLLEPSDIEAVGGYILASLPVEEILHAQHSTHIISAIGQLSLPELMLAASQDHFSALMDEYLNMDLNLTDILLLRNLIHFIPPSALVKINPMDMKYMIESSIIDKRLCADSSTRGAWANLLTNIYGPPSNWSASQLESVGDLMIAFSSDLLDTIDSAQWQLLADIAVTKYTDVIEWPTTSTFYQACMSTLIKSERKLYLEAVKSLARKYFTEVQHMASLIKLNTKEGSIVLIKTNISSLGSRPVPKIISVDEGGSSSEKGDDESFIEKSSTKSHHESTEAPHWHLISKGTSKLKSFTVSAFKTSSEIISTRQESPDNVSESGITSSTVKIHPSDASDGDHSPRPRSKSHDEDLSVEIYKDSKENGASHKGSTALKSAGFPSITEVSTGNPRRRNETPGIGSLYPDQDYELSPEFSDRPVVTSSVLAAETVTSNTTHMSLLSINILSEEDEDNGDLHASIFEPEMVEANQEKVNGNSGDSNEGVLLKAINESHEKHATIEEDELRVSSPSSDEKPKLSFGDSFFFRMLGLTTSSAVSTEEYSLAVSESVSEKAAENQSESDSSSSTTTEALEYELQDELSVIFFGREFTHQNMKLRKGFQQLIGIDKSSELPVPLDTTTQAGTDKTEPHVQSEDEKQSIESDLEESFAKDEEHLLTTSTSSAQPLADAILSNKKDSTPSNSESVTDLLPTSSATHQTVLFESINALGFLDVKSGQFATLDDISEILDTDYDQPRAEVYDRDGISSEDESSSSEIVGASAPHHVKIDSDRSHARLRRNAGQVFNTVFCDSVKVLGPSAVLALRDFDLHSVTNDELLNCVEDLGKLDLPQALKETIWQRIKSLEVVDMAVGTLAGAWKLDDVSNMTLNISEDWILEIIHLLSKFSKDTLVANAIVEKMRKQIFIGEAISEVPEAVTVAMGPLLCRLNLYELQLMLQTPGTFMHVIPIVGKMIHDCQMECLSKFAKLAVTFMDTPDLWTSDMVALLGPIPAGLSEDDWRLLASRPQAVAGLQPSALECLPQPFLQMMGVEALASLPPLTAKILTDQQLKQLDKQKADVLIGIKNEQWSLRNISALHRLNINTTPRPKVEVDLKSDCNSVIPSILIAVSSIAFLIS